MTVFQFPVDPYSGCSALPCSSVFFADAYAYSNDTLTFSTNGPQIPVQAVFTVTWMGFKTSTDPNNSLLTVNNGFEIYYGVGNHSKTYTEAFSVGSDGLAYPGLYLHLSAEITCTSLGKAPNNGVHLCTNSVEEDYKNTEKFTGITIEDMQGNPLTGYTVSSQSGYDYNPLLGASAAPEPGSLVLAGLGGLICLGVGRRVRRRA